MPLFTWHLSCYTGASECEVHIGVAWCLAESEGQKIYMRSVAYLSCQSWRYKPRKDGSCLRQWAQRPNGFILVCCRTGCTAATPISLWEQWDLCAAECEARAPPREFEQKTWAAVGLARRPSARSMKPVPKKLGQTFAISGQNLMVTLPVTKPACHFSNLGKEKKFNSSHWQLEHVSKNQRLVSLKSGDKKKLTWFGIFHSGTGR